MENDHRDLEKNELLELNEELENYFRNTVIPQLFVDANLILRKFTPPAMNQFELSAEDIGKPISELKNRIRFPTVIDNIREVIENKSDLEKDIQTTDMKWFQMNILPYVVGKTKETNGVIITFVEITSRIEILAQYEKLNKNFENVIYSLSHDLKGPIVNINSLVDLLKTAQENNKEEARDLLESMSISVDKLGKTIDDLTESVNDKTGFAEDSERVNIQNILEDATIGLRDKITLSNAKIHGHFEVTELNYSRKNIRSILYNLLSNAIKFSEIRGTPEIWVKTQNTKEYILLTVKDNGIGIKLDKQDLIFLPRIRLNQEVEGSGTGLFLVKRIVENMGGIIEVESAQGEGSTFRIYFKKEKKYQMYKNTLS